MSRLIHSSSSSMQGVKCGPYSLIRWALGCRPQNGYLYQHPLILRGAEGGALQHGVDPACGATCSSCSAPVRGALRKGLQRLLHQLLVLLRAGDVALYDSSNAPCQPPATSA